MEELTEKFEQLKKEDTVEQRCKGCGKNFRRLLKHLSAKGSTCKERYSKLQIDEHQKTIRKKKQAKYQTKNKEKIKLFRKTYDKANKAKVAEYKKTYDAANKTNIQKYKANYYKKKQEDLSEWEAVQVYLAETEWGPIFCCICCHRMLFQRSVNDIDIDKFRAKCSDIFDASVDMTALKDPIFKIAANLMKNEENYWMCHSCNSGIKKGQEEYRRKIIKLVKAADAKGIKRVVDLDELTEEEVKANFEWFMEEWIRMKVSPKYPFNKGDIDEVKITQNKSQDSAEALENLIADFLEHTENHLDDGETVLNEVFEWILFSFDSAMKTKDDDFKTPEYMDTVEATIIYHIIKNEDPDLSILEPSFLPEDHQWEKREGDSNLRHFHKIKFLIRALHVELSYDYDLTGYDLFCNLDRWCFDHDGGFYIIDE